MATQQISPGVITREVDLTVGRVDNVVANSGALAGPFKIGPVNEVIDITNEADLTETFGKPLSTDSQYEYWMSGASFLSYGGQLKVVRVDGADLKNSNAGAPINSVGIASTTTLKIKNFDDYDQSYTDITSGWTYAARTPGTWADGLKLCFIDDYADQTVGLTTTNLETAGFQIGCGVTVAYSGTTVGLGTTATTNGYVKGIITGVSTDSVNAASSIDVKIVSKVEQTGNIIGTETYINYAQFDEQASITPGSIVYCVSAAGTNKGGDYKVASVNTAGTVTDWYDNQTLDLTSGTVYWNTIAAKPQTNGYVENRDGKNDAFHLVLVDDTGSVSGIQGTILEKNIGISKASDTISEVNAPTNIYYKDFLANFSEYIYAGWNPSQEADNFWDTTPRATGFTTTTGVKSDGFTPVSTGSGVWGQDASGVIFSALGNVGYELGGGQNYAATGGAQYKANLGDLSAGYDLFENEDEVDIDFLIMGPSCGAKDETQAKANKLISIAEGRKDCMAVISPHKSDVVNVTSTSDQTNNVLSFYAPITSSSYAVFDSGYKWTYDRYNNKFRWLPTNPDVAGLMVRTDIEQFPWFSPAGQQRGNINNAVKLAYNPTKSQRDQLYENRINPITNLPGQGSVLFGDKTGLSYASAFDRINVRRLFITVESALQGVANAQLFEFNDEITRSNFVNVVEPYLRNIQSKRGLVDFRVICDATNNTPAVIDNNEFRADIFLKPTRSINYVTLTFVATRTGVSFEEVIGRV